MIAQANPVDVVKQLQGEPLLYLLASIGNFTDEQLREIELDGHMIRVDLTEIEAAERGAR